MVVEKCDRSIESGEAVLSLHALDHRCHNHHCHHKRVLASERMDRSIETRKARRGGKVDLGPDDVAVQRLVLVHLHSHHGEREVCGENGVIVSLVNLGHHELID